MTTPRFLATTTRRRWLQALVLGCGLIALGSCGMTPPDPFALPDTAYTTVVEGLQQQQPEVLWQALPSSYRQDLTGLIHQFAATVDGEVYDRSLALVGKAGEVLASKQELILSSGMLDGTGLEPERATAAIEAVAGLLTTVAGSELGSVETLKTVEPEAALATIGPRFMALAEELSKATPNDPYANQFLHQLDTTTVELVSTEGDSALIRVQLPSRLPEEQRLVRVDDRWVPEEMAKQWPQAMTDARARLAELEPERFVANKPQVLMALGMAEALLAQLEAAESPEQLQGVQQAIVGMMVAASMGQQQQSQ